MVFESDEFSASATITLYSADDLIFEIDGEITSVQDIIYSEIFTTEQKKRVLEPFVQKIIIEKTDVILYDVKGRYLWMAVDLYRQDELSPALQNFVIYFPKQTWMKYLPEIYQTQIPLDKSSFLERYLSVFQSLYDDINNKISDMPGFLDPYAVGEEYLSWLAEWLDIKESYLWSDSQLRYLIANASRLYSIRGTKRGISEFVTLFTGEIPQIVEYQQVVYFKNDNTQYALLEKLYNINPYVFTVLVKEEHVPSEKEYKMLLKIIEDIKPAYMEFDLVVLKPYIFLNSYSYLGINSVLGQYQDLSLNGFSLLPFSVINNYE